jgi:adenine deaminase
MARQIAAAGVHERPLDRLMKVALGDLAPDLAIVNARVVNVFTREVMENCAILIKGPWIAYVGDQPPEIDDATCQVIDAAAKTVIPGLIDGHTHMAWISAPEQFLQHVIPGGTTTIITETMEIYPVAGCEGVLDFLAALQDQPIKIFATAPAMISTSSETFGMGEADLTRLLARPEVLGMGEAYWQGVLQRPETILPRMQQTLRAGKLLEGHSAGARSRRLAAYAAIGISSCHEPITPAQALALLRLGIHVMAREGSIRRDLGAIAGLREAGIDLRRLILATDGITPGELLEKGYMEHVLQQAMAYGFDPLSAVQMVTLNVAEHFGMDHLVGGIAPGRYADLLILPDLTTITPEVVISSGRVVARAGQLLAAPRPHRYADHHYATIHLPQPLTAADFAIAVDPSADQVTVRVIEMVSDLVTGEARIRLPVQAGRLAARPDQGIIKVAAVARAHSPGRCFTGLLKGFGLTRGAAACSAAWDTADIIVAGAHEADMAAALNRVATLGGGGVVVADGSVLAEVALPLFGLMSELPMADLARALARLNQAMHALGVPFADPLLSLVTLTGAAIPFLRICDQGLVDLKSGRQVPLVIETRT